MNDMMKKLSNRKVGLVLLMIVMCLALPAHAQNRDAFFYNDNDNTIRNTNFGGYNIGTQIFGSEYGGFNITTQVFGQETPLDGGLFVLAISGVAYAIKKRKSNNKK